VVRDGGIFAKVNDDELDELLSLSSHATGFFSEWSAAKKLAPVLAHLKSDLTVFMVNYIEISPSTLRPATGGILRPSEPKKC